MSETSTPYTLASTFTTVAGNEMVSLVDEIKKYDMAKLIDFLCGEKDLGLDNDDLKIIRKEKVNGRAFLNLFQEELEHHEIKLGSAKTLAKFTKIKS